MNEISIHDEVIQTQGPCRGQVFIVYYVDGNMLHVGLKNPKSPYSRRPEWSHKDNYRRLTSYESGRN